jgi:Flp pilus assembly protein TadG
VSGPRGDRGNAALELVILAPVVVFLIGFVIAAGRTSVAQGSVNAAAREAARQASIAPNAATAQTAAVSTARAALRGDGLQCNPTVSLNLGGFGVPVGEAGRVSATVTCTEPLADLLVPGVPGARTLRATFTSPLDPFRSRSLP